MVKHPGSRKLNKSMDFVRRQMVNDSSDTDSWISSTETNVDSEDRKKKQAEQEKRKTKRETEKKANQEKRRAKRAIEMKELLAQMQKDSEDTAQKEKDTAQKVSEDRKKKLGEAMGSVPWFLGGPAKIRRLGWRAGLNRAEHHAPEFEDGWTELDWRQEQYYVALHHRDQLQHQQLQLLVLQLIPMVQRHVVLLLPPVELRPAVLEFRRVVLSPVQACPPPQPPNLGRPAKEPRHRSHGFSKLLLPVLADLLRRVLLLLRRVLAVLLHLRQELLHLDRALRPALLLVGLLLRLALRLALLLLGLLLLPVLAVHVRFSRGNPAVRVRRIIYHLAAHKVHRLVQLAAAWVLHHLGALCFCGNAED